jgi:hypothetical protein
MGESMGMSDRRSSVVLLPRYASSTNQLCREWVQICVNDSTVHVTL